MKLFFTISLLVVFADGSKAQQLFIENFDSATLNELWQIIAGNWQRADVQDLKIAPAENGRQFVLRSDSAGLIRLFIDLPLNAKGKMLQLSFSYYTYAKGIAPQVETGFYKKQIKDGIRGKPARSALPVKGMWISHTRTFTVPADANQFRVIFSNPRSSPTGKVACFDVVSVSLLK